MTKITITRTQRDTYRSIECTGHAGYAQYGNDIVCAAVSVLTINTVNSIDQLTSDEIIVSEDEKKGMIKLEFKTDPSKEADLLLRSYELGVNSIFQQYGKKFLNIKFRRETSC
jgi:uncharacterized protein YsxB (DUF464 family)